MRPWLSRTLLIVGTVGMCWAGTIWYWRASNRMPSTADLLVYLLILPLVLLLAFWGGKKLWPLLAGAPVAASAAAAVPAPATAAPVSVRAAPLDVIASALRMPHGESAAELAEAMAADEVRPELDAELNGNDGFPILSGRIAAVDEAAQEDAMASWLAQHGHGARFDAEQWRALALGSAVMTELAQQAMLHQALPAYVKAAPAARVALPLPMLQFLPLWPAEWSLPQRQVAGSWFLHLLVQQGWPAERATLSLAGERKDASPASLIGQLALQGAQEGLPCLAILFACASYVGELSVTDWAARGILLTSKNPHGQIPGEGAAGLLLADAAQAALLTDNTAVQLHGAGAGRRASSADAGGRVNADLLGSLSAQALHATDAAQVSLITADNDLRASRMSEMMEMAQGALPQIDLSSQVMSVAVVCGHAGAASALAALALAHHAADADASHVLCISNHDPFQRSAVLVRPSSSVPA
ncbi:hypothetical protein AAKU55_003269 [Oxalobacteraceae bacterium GrIS 1.11]